MNLEEIISAAVEKKLDEILEQAVRSDAYDSALGYIRKRIAEMTAEEFKKREDEFRAAVAEKVQGMDLNVSMDCYVKIKKDAREQ